MLGESWKVGYGKKNATLRSKALHQVRTEQRDRAAITRNLCQSQYNSIKAGAGSSKYCRASKVLGEVVTKTVRKLAVFKSTTLSQAPTSRKGSIASSFKQVKSIYSESRKLIVKKRYSLKAHSEKKETLYVSMRERNQTIGCRPDRP